MAILQRRFARVAARSVAAAAVCLAVLGSVASAQASVIFDFIQIVADNGEGPFNNDPTGYATQGGITIQATASGFTGSLAYLDAVAFSDDRPAGLGACHGFTGGEPPQCDPSSEDNVTAGETLTLSFFSDTALENPLTVVLDPTFFRDANHFGVFVTGDMIDITDASGTTTYQLPLLGEFTTPLTGTTFDFTYNGVGDTQEPPNNAEFYIGSVTVSPVPLPAALPLFLSALAGLALLGRRQRKKAAA